MSGYKIELRKPPAHIFAILFSSVKHKPFLVGFNTSVNTFVYSMHDLCNRLYLFKRSSFHFAFEFTTYAVIRLFFFAPIA